MKKLKDISVRELLSIEDGFYKLETPVAYTMSESDPKELFSAEFQLDYWTDKGRYYVNFDNGEIAVQSVVGDNYHVKLEFSSGLVVEKDIECVDGGGGYPELHFDDSMFDNLDAGFNGIGLYGEEGMAGSIVLTTPHDQNRGKYGDNVVITVAEVGKHTNGEISGVINISTDTKILDGVTKVITALADDTSYYVDNIWQDGDALEVSAMDETSGGDEDKGKRETKDLTYTVDGSNITLDEVGQIVDLAHAGYELTITVNEEFASVVSNTKVGDVYIMTHINYFAEDSAITSFEASLTPLPYSELFYAGEPRLGRLYFTSSGEFQLNV